MTGILFNAPLKRNVRRGLVVVALGMLILYHVLGFFTDNFGSGILYILAYWLLFMRLSRSTSLFRGKKLDERQQSLRNRAFYLTFLVAAPFAWVMWLLNTFDLGSVKFYFQRPELAEILSYVNMSLVTSLPVMYIAWLEPDPVKEDAPEGFGNTSKA